MSYQGAFGGIYSADIRKEAAEFGITELQAWRNKEAREALSRRPSAWPLRFPYSRGDKA